MDKNFDVKTFNQDTDFVNLLSDCGSTQLISDENRHDIYTAILFQEVIGKRTAALEQLREGLKTLDVIDCLSNNPMLCMPLFMYEEENVSCETVKDILLFDTSCSEQTKENLLKCVTEMTKSDLVNFIHFISASRVLPRKRITIKVDEADGVFASTCLLQLVLPKQADTFEKLVSAIHSVIGNKGQTKSFTVV